MLKFSEIDGKPGRWQLFDYRGGDFGREHIVHTKDGATFYMNIDGSSYCGSAKSVYPRSILRDNTDWRFKPVGLGGTNKLLLLEERT